MRAYDEIKYLCDKCDLKMYAYSERPVIYAVGEIDLHGGFTTFYNGVYKEVKAYLKGRIDCLEEQQYYDMKMGYTE